MILVAVLIQNLPDRYIDKLLEKLAIFLESSAHVQYYTQWSLHLLTLHGPALKLRSQSIISSTTALQKVLTRRHEQLRKM